MLDARRRNGCATEAERSAYAEGLSDAAQRVRYYLKHQNLTYEDDLEGYYNTGIEATCNNLNELLTELAEQAEIAPLHVSDEPLPCPFCYKPAMVDVEKNMWQVGCFRDACGLEPFTMGHPTRAGAVALWNNRTPRKNTDG